MQVLCHQESCMIDAVESWMSALPGLGFSPIHHFQGYYCKKQACAGGGYEAVAEEVKPDTWLVA